MSTNQAWNIWALWHDTLSYWKEPDDGYTVDTQKRIDIVKNIIEVGSGFKQGFIDTKVAWSVARNITHTITPPHQPEPSTGWIQACLH